MDRSVGVAAQTNQPYFGGDASWDRDRTLVRDSTERIRAGLV